MPSWKRSRFEVIPLIEKQANPSHSRKDKPAAQILAQSFSWGEALDAVADVYNGVCMIARKLRFRG
jgi:hypothetical protein